MDTEEERKRKKRMEEERKSNDLMDPSNILSPLNPASPISIFHTPSSFDSGSFSSFDSGSGMGHGGHH